MRDLTAPSLITILLVEDVAQLPCYLAVFPGAGGYQVRRKGCTTRNAADLIPLFEPWHGGPAADSLLTTPLGTTLRFGLFDPSMGNAFHGLMCADTGAGKSLTAGALVTDAFIAGKDAILVDNGGSWARLTRLLGGPPRRHPQHPSSFPTDMVDAEHGRAGPEHLTTRWCRRWWAHPVGVETDSAVLHHRREPRYQAVASLKRAPGLRHDC
jgi:hypothetical protein